MSPTNDSETLLVVFIAGAIAFVLVLIAVIAFVCVMRFALRKRGSPAVTQRHDTTSFDSGGTTVQEGEIVLQFDDQVYDD